MTTPIIRVLLAEDSAADAELVVRELKRAELLIAHRVVDSEESFTDALHSFVPDVILSDFSMPGFDGEAALDCFITIDAQGCVIEFNPAAEKTFGYAREEVLGKDLAGLIIPAGMHASHRQGLKHYHATGEGPILGKRIEVSAMRKDGSE